MKYKNYKTAFGMIFLLAIMLFSLSPISADVVPYCDNSIQPATFSATNVGETSATLQGSAYKGDTDAVYAGFAYREDGSSSWTTISNSFAWYDSALGDDYDYTFTGLDSDTTYNYKAVITKYELEGSTENYFCEDSVYFSFTTDEESTDPPTVQTNAVTSITDTTATFNGEVSNMNDASSATPFFGYREEEGSWTYTSDLDDISNPSSFFYEQTELDPDTTYEVKAWVDSEYGTASGDTVIFTTDEIPGTTPPTLSLNTPSILGENSATLSANVDDLGGYINLDVKFFYKRASETGPISPISASEETVSTTGEVTYEQTGLSDNTEYEYTLGYYDTEEESYVLHNTTQTFTTQEESLDWINTTKSNETTTGTFSESLSDLDPNTEYSFRACVETDLGLNCNETLTFTTNNLTDPIIDTLDATNISTDSALLKGEVTDLGDYSSVDVYFGINENGTGYTSLVGSQETLNSAGEFEYNVEDLNYNTNYTYRAVAFETDKYNVEGSEKEFTTDDIALTPPVEYNEFPDLIMNFTDNYTIDVGDYYSYYDDITLEVDGNTLSLDGDGFTLTDGTDPILGIALDEVLDNWFIDFQSYEVEENYTINYNISNSEDTLERNFTVSIIEGAETTPEPPEEDENDTDGELNGVFGTITTWFLSIFPDSDDMTTSQKIGFMVVVMFIVSLLIVALTFATTKNITMGVMYFILVVNALLFFFFASIGYVPVGFLIVMGITVFVLGVLKLKNAFSGGGE